MDRRAVAVVVGLVVVTAAVGAAVLFQGPPRVVLEPEPGAADQVTLYQNGLAFVELERTFDTGGGEAVLVFAAPTTTVFDSFSIEADGITVKEVRSALSTSPIVQPGDDVVVHARDDTSYSGTVVAFDYGAIVLSTDTGTTAVEMNQVIAIDIAGTEPVERPGTVEVGVLVDATEGVHDVRVSYLARGTGWTPSYKLDVVTGHLEFSATLSGLQDWTDVSLDIVSGSPRVVTSGGQTPSYDLVEERGFASDTAGTSAPGGSGFGASTPLGELHRYHLDRKVNLTRGHTVRLPVLTGEVDLSRHYFAVDASTGWGGTSGERRTVNVLERYELHNTLTEPLPPGVVRFYRDDTWIGEDMLESTPVDARTNVTVSRSEDVRAHTILRSLQSSETRDTYTYALTIENFKTDGAPIDVRATQSFPTFRTNVLETTPPADDVAGGAAIWNDSIAPGASATYVLTYEQLRNR